MAHKEKTILVGGLEARKLYIEARNKTQDLIGTHNLGREFERTIQKEDPLDCPKRVEALAVFVLYAQSPNVGQTRLRPSPSFCNSPE